MAHERLLGLMLQSANGAMRLSASVRKNRLQVGIKLRVSSRQRKSVDLGEYVEESVIFSGGGVERLLGLFSFNQRHSV